jgi:hypothetical protein
MTNDFQNYLTIYSSIRKLAPKLVEGSLQLDYHHAHLAQHWTYSIPEKIHLSAFIQNSSANHKQRTCIFGFWETVDDEEINLEAFTELKRWAKKHHCQSLIGPINGSTYRAYRIKVDAFDQRPYWGEPWTPPYYQKILNDQGFITDQSYTSYLVKDSNILKNWLAQNPINLSIKALTRDLDFRSISSLAWENILPQLEVAAEEIFGDNYIYSSLTNEEFSMRFGQNLKQQLCEKSSRLIFDSKQRPVGAGLCFPDPLATSKTPRLLIRTIGVKREFRKFGATYLRLIHEMAQNSIDKYQEFMFCLMKKGNLPDLMGKELANFQYHYELQKLTL